MTQLIASVAELCLLFLLPGSLLLIVFRSDRVDLAQTLLYGFAFSTAMVIFVSALLLWVGAFSVSALLAIMTGSAIVLALVAMRQRMAVGRSLQEIVSSDSLLASLGPIVVAAFVVSLGLLTPHWNFLLGSNMDAGNYEVYGNHFLRTGSFFLESEALNLEGVPASWIESGNSWNVVPGTTSAKPSFFPGFPVLLAVFKGVFGTPLASTWVSLVLAAASAGLLARTAVYVLRSNWLGSFLALYAVLTPIFFFYSKQIMSEAVALLGVSLIVDVLVRYPSWRSKVSPLTGAVIGTGMFLALIAKLDSFVLLALLPIPLVMIGLDRHREGHPRLDRLNLGLGPVVGVLLATSLIALMADPGYASKLIPGRMIEFVSPPIAILGYGLGFAGAMVGIWLFLRWYSTSSSTALPKPETNRVHSMYRWGSWLAATWLLFVLWNLTFRPRVPFEVDHNPHNLLRLFDVLDPALMALFLIASVAVLAIGGGERPVIIMLLIGLTVLIITSRHNRTELWWMRRYLYWLVPVVVVTLAWGFKRVVDSSRRTEIRRVLVTVVGATLLGLVLFRAIDMRPLFQLEYNPTTPHELHNLSELLQSGDVVVIPEGNRSIRALVNTKRSLDGQTMLGTVRQDDLTEALEVARDLGSRVVLATEIPRGDLMEDIEGEFRAIGSGIVTEPGVHLLAHVRSNPTRATTVEYELFAVDP